MTPASYPSLTREVIANVSSFRRDHDPDLLQRAAEALQRFPEPSTGLRSRTFLADGWVIPERGVRLRARTLKQLNPGYRIRIRRHGRRELGLRARLLRVGFRVAAVGSSDLPAFILRVSDRQGALGTLPASNLDAEYALEVIESGRSAAQAPPSFTSRGYIDMVLEAPALDLKDPTTWLAAFVHKYRAMAIEIADSPYGKGLAPIIASILRTFPSNSRWADRAELVSSGSAGTYGSSLEPLVIRRTDRGEKQEGQPTAPRPSRQGAVVRWSPGAHELLRPSDVWQGIDDARLQGGGTISTGNELIVYENSADPSWDFVAGQWRTVFGSATNREMALLQRYPQAEKRIAEGILLSGRNDENWFHWLIEYLPRALMVPADIAEDVPFLVSSRTPATGLQALAELSTRPVVIVDESLSQPVDVLHLVAPPVQVLDTTKVPWEEGLRLNIAALERVRAVWTSDDAPAERSRRVFLQRRSRHRGLKNEDQLAGIAAAHGFEIVDPGSLDFAAQRALFRGAEVLVGASGAVMANYILMSPGSHIVALTSAQLFDFALPAALAAIANVDFRYVTGPSETSLRRAADRNHWIHSDFQVRPKDFELALAAVLDEREQGAANPLLG